MDISSNLTEQKEHEEQSACACGSGGCGSHSHARGRQIEGKDIPDRFQLLQEGDRVVELGSGLGHDSITMAQLIGPSGKVVGIDLSEDNIRTARGHLDSSRISNVEFRQGDIAAIPLPHEFADVIYASCVFNLQSNKQKVADEMYRVCDHKGYVCVSDFVIINDIPDGLRKEAAKMAGCIEGAEKAEVFMNYFLKTGFSKGGIVEVEKVKLPIEMLEKHLSPAMVRKYNDADSDDGIFSVVLLVEKPETCSAETCCGNPDKHKN
jgi:arsenite methyltransferase